MLVELAPQPSARRIVVDNDGVRRFAARRLLVFPFPRIVCIDNPAHELRRISLALEESTIRCEHRLANGAACLCCMYVVADWHHLSDGSRLSLVVEVTEGEINAMRRYSLSKKLEYLGLMPKLEEHARHRR